MAGRVPTRMPTSCVVTGGARGIGRGIAELMVARGHHVVIGDVDGWSAAATAAEIGAVAGLLLPVLSIPIGVIGGAGIALWQRIKR